MSLSQDRRILLIEQTLDAAAKLPNVGGYKAIIEVANFLRTMLTTNRNTPMVSTYIKIDIIMQLREIGVTEEDIVLVEKKREKNRALIQQRMVHVLETAREKKLYESGAGLTAKDFKKYFLDAISDNADQAYKKYFSDEDVAYLREQRILFVDTDWVFQPRNINGIDLLLENTTLNVHESYDFYETLALEEKDSLAKIIKRAQDLIAREVLGNITDGSFEAQAAAVYNFDVKTLSGSIPSNFINIIFTNKLKDDLVTQMIDKGLMNLYYKYKDILLNQTEVPANFSNQGYFGWFNCVLNNAIGVFHRPNPDGVITMRYKPAPCTLSTSGTFNQTYGPLKEYVMEIMSKPYQYSGQLVDSFKTALNCYVADYTAKACQYYMKGASEFLGAQIVPAIDSVKSIASTAAAEVVNEITKAPSQSSQEPASTARYVVGGLVLSSAALACYCFFSSKKHKHKYDPVIRDEDHARDVPTHLLPEDYSPDSQQSRAVVTINERRPGSRPNN